jgi:hypothetical protein
VLSFAKLYYFLYSPFLKKRKIQSL